MRRATCNTARLLSSLFVTYSFIMPRLEIQQQRYSELSASQKEELYKLCPFSALEDQSGQLVINAGCKMCRLCVKKGGGIVQYVEDTQRPTVDKSLWRGIAVVAEVADGRIHPVAFELLGKAREMAQKVDYPVFCLLIGADVRPLANQLISYGADEVFVYDNPALKFFRIEPYTAVVEDFINKVKPSVVLVGGTQMGRSLAPRTAARFRTGLTADCTILDIQSNTDLDQIRPAYGGNIMAHINTPNHRPQFATVRYKIFSIPEPNPTPAGTITDMSIDPERLASAIIIEKQTPKVQQVGIEESEVLVVAGRGLKKPDDIELLQKLADLLGGRVAGTRPTIEAGWLKPQFQIGLSGRTVKPKLIITCGVSGAIQFVAGMKGSEHIIAINTDPNASIFKVAHVGIVGDLYEIVPRLIEQIQKGA